MSRADVLVDADWVQAHLGDPGVGKDTIAYCRIGERSAHTWFVLHELLGQPNVQNYDGSVFDVATGKPNEVS